MSPTTAPLTQRYPDRLKPTPKRLSVSPAAAVPAVQRQTNCACGGGCPRCQNELMLQTKLNVSHPGDRYEQEADRIAGQVMRSAIPTHLNSIKRTNQSEDVLQPKQQPVSPEQATVLLPDVEAKIANPIGGTPLPDSARTFFENRFGRDLRDVRIHSGHDAHSLSESIQAHAFTHQNHIWLGSGLTPEPSHILAHELTHVIQQNGADGVRATIQRTHFSSEYTSWSVAPHVRQAGESQTYSLDLQLNVAMELALFSEAMTDEIDVGAVQALISDTLNQFGGGWREIGGQRVYVNWTLNWVSPSAVDRGRAIGIAVLPESVFEGVRADGIFMHEGSLNRILLRGAVAERVLRPSSRAERRTRGARRTDRQERERARRRFGHEVTHEIGHALGLSHQARTVMNATNSDRIDRFLTGEQIRQIVLNITTDTAALPAWLRGEAHAIEPVP